MKTVDTILDNNKHDLGGNKRIKKEILELLLERLPEDREGDYCGEDDCCICEEYNSTHNHVMKQVRNILKKVFSE